MGVNEKQDEGICEMWDSQSDIEEISWDDAKQMGVYINEETKAVLDHLPQHELKQKEVAARKKNIIVKLKLDENEVLKSKPELKEATVKLWLQLWAAISLGVEDVG